MKTISMLLAVLCSISVAQEIKRSPAVENYRQQISTLNLVNAMYLSPSQVQDFLKELRSLKEVQEEFQEKSDDLVPAMQEEYARLFQEIVDNKGISKPTEKTAGDVHKKELGLKEEYASKLIELESRLSKLLTENQLCVVDEFKPCLIPPKNLRDPARVGQAKGDTYGAVSVLEQIRKVPPKRYEAAKGRALEQYLDKYEKKIELLPPEKKDAEAMRVSRILDYARNLSSIDFEMKKESLAKEILIELEVKKRKNELGKVGKLLLDVRLIPILEKRLLAVN